MDINDINNRIDDIYLNNTNNNTNDTINNNNINLPVAKSISNNLINYDYFQNTKIITNEDNEDNRYSNIDEDEDDEYNYRDDYDIFCFCCSDYCRECCRRHICDSHIFKCCSVMLLLVSIFIFVVIISFSINLFYNIRKLTNITI